MSEVNNCQKNLLNFLNNNPSERYPVWFLRQAGRYLPEYQKIRSNMSFIELCNHPQKAAEVTLMPLKRFDLDAAIVFSDILILPQALGINLSFAKDHGPRLSPTVGIDTDLESLDLSSLEKKFSPLSETLQIVSEKLDPHVSLIGFAGAPFTLASYMIEGMTSKNFITTKSIAFSHPSFFTKLLNILSAGIKKLLTIQKNAGADILMLFDSWAGSLHPSDYQKIVVPIMKPLLKELRAELNCPVIYYPGQNPNNLESVSELSLGVLAVDWRFCLKKLNTLFKHCFVQGNLDPASLFASKDFIRDKVSEILSISNEYFPNRHIFNVGHGLLPQTPISSLCTVVETIRGFRT